MGFRFVCFSCSLKGIGLRLYVIINIVSFLNGFEQCLIAGVEEVDNHLNMDIGPISTRFS